MDYRDTRAYILDPCIQEFLKKLYFDNQIAIVKWLALLPLNQGVQVQTHKLVPFDFFYLFR